MWCTISEEGLNTTAWNAGVAQYTLRESKPSAWGDLWGPVSEMAQEAGYQIIPLELQLNLNCRLSDHPFGLSLAMAVPAQSHSGAPRHIQQYVGNLLSLRFTCFLPTGLCPPSPCWRAQWALSLKEHLPCLALWKAQERVELLLKLDPVCGRSDDFQKCPKVVQATMLAPSVSTLVPCDKHCSVS